MKIFRNKERLLELIFISAFILLFLSLGIGKIFDNRIVHDYPPGYLASDVFFHYAASDSIKLTGGFEYYHSSLVGGFDDVLAVLPPLFYVTTNLFSSAVGIENYDSLMLITFVIYVLIFLVTYLFIRDFLGKKIAILSLPAFLFILIPNFNIAITWGRQYNILGFLFLISFFYVFWKFRFDKPILLGIISASLFLAYTEMMTYVVLITVFYVVYDLFFLKKKYNLKKVIMFGATAAIISFYYFIVFYNTFMKIEKRSLPTFQYISPVGGYRYPLFNQFGWIGIVALLGILFAFFIFKKEKITSMLLFFSLFILGYGNIIGYSRALRLRFFWPIVLALFLGVMVYSILVFSKSVIRFKLNGPVYYVVSGLLILLFYLTIYSSQPFHLSPYSIATPADWEAFEYIDDNADEDAKIFLSYGNQFDQGFVPARTRRTNYYVKSDAWTEGFQTNTINRYYNTFLRYEHGGAWGYRKSFFDFGYHLREVNDTYTNLRDICDFDYYLFAKQGTPRELIYYNLVFANLMLSDYGDNFEKAFENNMMVIIKNKKIEGDCIEDKTVVKYEGI